jgi:hypothetical protein
MHYKPEDSRLHKLRMFENKSSKKNIWTRERGIDRKMEKLTLYGAS